MERDFMRNIEGGGDVPNSAANSMPSSAAGPKVPLPAGSGRPTQVTDFALNLTMTDVL
jgi:hypothetical protein